MLPPFPPREGPALELTIRSSEDLQPMPSRVLIRAVAPTKPVNFAGKDGYGKDLSPAVLGSDEGVLLVSGTAILPMPPGTYDLTLLQGPEYELVRKQVTIGEKEIVPVDVTLEHVVRTDGWIAADMHIHSERSYDSKMPQRHRVISEVASGIELLVPTEHAVHNDLQIWLASLGYTERAVSIPGSEYGFKWGHLGVYPVDYRPAEKMFGAPDWQEWPKPLMVDDVSAFAMIHGQPLQPLVIINHPRLPPDLGYFMHLGWPHSPGELLPTAGTFDGMEVLSGYQHLPQELTALMQDWFQFLGQGHRTTALGNSDTHRMTAPRSGYPRTWLRLATEVPARVLPEDLRNGLLGMHAVASNGPWVQLSIEGAGVGDTFRPLGPRPTSRAHVVADAPGWIDLTRLQVYQNGRLLRELPISRNGHPALDESIVIDTTTDGWVVAVALGDMPLPAEIVGLTRMQQPTPIAITNPVWIDADGDGKVKPPLSPPDSPKPWGLLPERLLTPSDYLPHDPLDCGPEL